MDFHISTWLKVTLELGSWTAVIAAYSQIIPAVAATLGLVYWTIMIWKAWKGK